ncbi:MAG TPA: type 4a pilus biogenesis protein PilO [Bacillota bacterium]|nr:type 4a pilus biogenesis protein PilO [Bacillota bacterium]
MRINLSKREKVLVLLAFAVVLFFLYHRYYLVPILEEAAAIKEEMRKSQERFTNLITGGSDIGTLEKRMEEIKSNLGGMEIALPPGPNTPEIITQIENCSKAAGVELGRMDFLEIAAPQGRPGEQKQGVHYIKVPVQVHISGSYGGIMAFIKALEESERLYSITGFDLYNAGQENGHILNMDIELCAYALPMGEKPIKDALPQDFTGYHYGRNNPFTSAAE